MEVTFSVPLVYVDKALPIYQLEYTIEMPKLPSDEVDDMKLALIKGRLEEILTSLTSDEKKTPQRIVQAVWQKTKNKYTDFAILAITFSIAVETEITRIVFTKKDIVLT